MLLVSLSANLSSVSLRGQFGLIDVPPLQISNHFNNSENTETTEQPEEPGTVIAIH